jgi:hypothetical protein
MPNKRRRGINLDPAFPQMLVFRSFNLSGAAAAAIPLYAM